MKKIITLLYLLLVASLAANAQYADKPNNASILPVATYTMPNGQIVEFQNTASRELFNMQNTEIYNLLQTENKFLSHRNIATILSLSGTAVAVIGASIRDGNGRVATAGQVIGTTGTIVAGAGAVWLLVNEFQIISTRKKINSCMQVRLFPNGLKVEF